MVVQRVRGVPAARTWLRRARQTTGPLSISVVSIAEVTGGMRTEERSGVWRLLATLRTEGVNEVIARRAGELMRRYRASHATIGLGDYLIAATVEVRGLELASLNVRHFPMLKRLRTPFRLP